MPDGNPGHVRRVDVNRAAALMFAADQTRLLELPKGRPRDRVAHHLAGTAHGYAHAMAIFAKSVKQAAARFGLDVHRVRDDPTEHEQRGILLRCLGVTVVLDVGANVGQYANDYLRRYTRYDGRIVSFEPVAEAYRQCVEAAVSDSRWSVRRCALSNTAGVITMHVPAGHTELSSFGTLTPTAARVMETSGVHDEQVDVCRLDDLFDHIVEPDDVVALKLDVQGHEPAVLAGAADSLARVALIECELPLVGLYEQQPSPESMLGLLRESGFGLVGVWPNYLDRATGQTLDADAFFVRQ